MKIESVEERKRSIGMNDLVKELRKDMVMGLSHVAANEIERLQQSEANLSMLVKRYIKATKNNRIYSDLQRQALSYLKKHNLIGNPLRKEMSDE